MIKQSVNLFFFFFLYTKLSLLEIFWFSIKRIRKEADLLAKSSMIITSINKGIPNLGTLQNHSQLSNKSFKQPGSKSTQEKYEDLFKTLGANYLEKTAVGAIVNKNFIKNSIARPNSVRQMSNQYSNRNCSNNFQIVEQFNEIKQINKLLKLGDVFDNNQSRKKAFKSSKNIPQESKNNQNNDKCKIIQIIQQQKQAFNVLNSNKFITRPTTTGTNRKFERYISARCKKSRINFKFIQIQGKIQTKNIKRLKRSVDELQNIAINKYGVQFKSYDIKQGSKNEHNTHLRIQQITKKLKQIRNQRQQKQTQQQQDCTIPSHFMKILSSKKKNAFSLCNLTKKSYNDIYLRV